MSIELDDDEDMGEEVVEIRPNHLDKTPLDDTPCRRAPTAVIEASVIGRPLKVLSILLFCLAGLCLFVCSASADWLRSHHMRVGLWEECSMNFTDVTDHDCTSGPCNKDYAQVCAWLTVASLGSLGAAVLLFAVGMQLSNTRVKLHLYCVVAGIVIIAMVLFLIPLVIYPFKFMQELIQHERSELPGGPPIPFSIGWAYFMGWAGLLIASIGLGLLLKDRKSDEVIFREKVHYEALE